jgi:hypothetical protein
MRQNNAADSNTILYCITNDFYNYLRLIYNLDIFRDMEFSIEP